MEEAIPDEVARRPAAAEAGDAEGPGERGAVWTYLTTGQPFGSSTKRVLEGILRKLRR